MQIQTDEEIVGSVENPLEKFLDAISIGDGDVPEGPPMQIPTKPKRQRRSGGGKSPTPEVPQSASSKWEKDDDSASSHKSYKGQTKGKGKGASKKDEEAEKYRKHTIEKYSKIAEIPDATQIEWNTRDKKGGNAERQNPKAPMLHPEEKKEPQKKQKKKVENENTSDASYEFIPKDTKSEAESLISALHEFKSDVMGEIKGLKGELKEVKSQMNEQRVQTESQKADSETEVKSDNSSKQKVASTKRTSAERRKKDWPPYVDEEDSRDSQWTSTPNAKEWEMSLNSTRQGWKMYRRLDSIAIPSTDETLHFWNDGPSPDYNVPEFPLYNGRKVKLDRNTVWNGIEDAKLQNEENKEIWRNREDWLRYIYNGCLVMSFELGRRGRKSMIDLLEDWRKFFYKRDMQIRLHSISRHGDLFVNLDSPAVSDEKEIHALAPPFQRISEYIYNSTKHGQLRVSNNAHGFLKGWNRVWKTTGTMRVGWTCLAQLDVVPSIMSPLGFEIIIINVGMTKRSDGKTKWMISDIGKVIPQELHTNQYVVRQDLILDNAEHFVMTYRRRCGGKMYLWENGDDHPDDDKEIEWINKLKEAAKDKGYQKPTGAKDKSDYKK